MSRLQVPIQYRTLYATGDILLRIELELEVKDHAGAWPRVNFLVDSGTEITTVPAWLAKQLNFPMPISPTRGPLTPNRPGDTFRLAMFPHCWFRSTNYTDPLPSYGGPESRPQPDAPVGMLSSKTSPTTSTPQPTSLHCRQQSCRRAAFRASLWRKSDMR